ncbi:glycosyltransferase [Paraburkholderia hospita]|uniref:glycosyltransferase n=1 Tax=Paraburkholderia hospita TaxID=169430 RepID=UPI0005561B6E|nr:glycosyltransferase [Paraburkholderia hospita]
MIFLTVGTQMPFDRLVRLTDCWAEKHPEVKVFAQICNGACTPVNINYSAFLSREEMERLTTEATLVISHAGMGSILTARRLRKPIVVVPRQHRLNEHRNDHQIDTARSLEGLVGIHVCWQESEFDEIIKSALEGAQRLDFDRQDRGSSDLSSCLAAWVNAQ